MFQSRPGPTTHRKDLMAEELKKGAVSAGSKKKAASPVVDGQERDASSLDTVKLIIALLLVVGGIVAFYYFEEQMLLVRVIALLILVGLSAAAVYSTAPGKTIWGFMKESRVEVRKVVWPSRQEATQTTLIVVVMVFFMGVFLWLLDMFLFWGIRSLPGQGG